LCAVLFAGSIALILSGPAATQTAKQSPSEPKGLPLPDEPLKFFWAENLRTLIRDLEIRDSTEAGLLLLGQPSLTNEWSDSGGVSSMSIVTHGQFASVSKEYETRRASEVIRFRRVTAPNVRSPIAILATAYCVNGQPKLAQTFYRLDERGRWLECSGRHPEVNLPTLDFSAFLPR
jgi:hypothetical protein